MAEAPGAETGGWQSDNKLLQEESHAQHCGVRVLPPPRLLPFSSHRKDKDTLGQGHCPRADVGGIPASGRATRGSLATTQSVLQWGPRSHSLCSFFAEWEYLTAFWDALLITLALTYDTQISYLSHFHPVLSKADKCQTSQLFGSWLAWVQP